LLLRIDSGFHQAFKFEPAALLVIVRPVRGVAQAVCTGMAAISVMASPLAVNALPCSVIGVQIVG